MGEGVGAVAVKVNGAAGTGSAGGWGSKWGGENVRTALRKPEPCRHHRWYYRAVR